ncbi:glycoside hydrolase family 30 protein [Niabella ginsenosidivorans]|nr:glycoside hydrolase family 30 beta sandwich domain-containing protein [Niabella ginsenosidivorans]
MMKKRLWSLPAIGLALLFIQCNKKASPGKTNGPAEYDILHPDAWITKADQSALLQKTDLSTAEVAGNSPVITIDTSRQYQTVDGFGYTLTGGSAVLINQLPAEKKQALLEELFGNNANAIGVSYLRLSVGASDLDSVTFSYNDLPAGETDVDQSKFSLAPDQSNLIPVLKRILAINPAIKIIAAPWSAPAWMKDNNSTKGGSLKPDYYDAYATYFVKYIQAMQAEGITINAITPQNEPYHPGNNPSLYMTATMQRDFIKNHLGPAFAKNNIRTKIVVYDHNLDKPLYADTIYQDPGASKYVDGAAFHLYAGEVSAMGQLHDRHPDKQLYFTEQWTGSREPFNTTLLWHIKNVIIGTLHNWSKIALEWNLANDPSFRPHTPGGCTECKGAVTINGNSFTRNVSYYIIAHASKFIPPGARRIESAQVNGLSNVAFITPAGKKVLLVLNENVTPVSFKLQDGKAGAPISLPAGSVATLVW